MRGFRDKSWEKYIQESFASKFLALYENTRHHDSIETAERFKIGMESFLGKNVARALIYSICMFNFNINLIESDQVLLGLNSKLKVRKLEYLRRPSRMNPHMLTGVEIVENQTLDRKKPEPFNP